MQSIGKLSARAIDYYADQLTHSVGEDVPVVRAGGGAEVDYYAAHSSPSRWMGSGLDRVGLEAATPIERGVFEDLMNHRTPGGESMVRPHAKHGTVAAFDHTFSAPKSISLVYAFGDDDAKRAVVESHHAAVAEAVGYMEENCSQSRVGTRYRDDTGRWKVKTQTASSDGYMAAAFDHFTSRANDPQVHTHVVVINRVWASDGWRAIDAKRAYAHAKAGGSIYQAALRQQLTDRLGVSWQPVVNGLSDIHGFSPELLRHFSTRRSEIVDAVERYVAQHGGEAHRKVWQTVTLQTRQPKSHPAGEAAVTREMKAYGVTTDVVAHWQRRAVDAPEDVLAVVRSVLGQTVLTVQPTPEHIASASIDLVEWVSDRQAVFTERDLVAHVSSLFPQGTGSRQLVDATRVMLDAAQKAGQVLTVLPHAESGLVLPDGIALSTDELEIAVGQGPGWIAQGGTVRFRALPGEARYTTRLQLQREETVLAAVSERSPVTADPVVLEQAITDRALVDGQVDAIRHLADLDGRLVAMVGPGGSGKTYSVGAYAEAARTAGHTVIGLATSAAAARQLAGDLGDNWTGTIAMLRHHLDSYGQELATGTLLIADEASMISTRDLAWLVDQARRCDGKLVLIGDPKQLPSVDSGGLYHRIVASGEQVVDDLVRVNQRQQHDLDRHLLDRLRAGEIRAAVRDYAEAGRLHLGRDEYATKAAMVDAWWADVERHGLDGVRMLASRHDEVWMLNQLARVRMDQAGELIGGPVVNRWGIEFQVGDRIVVRDNWYAHSDLRNGQTGTVVATDPLGASLSFRRDLDGALIELPRRYLDRDVDHAYAQTIHTAQGQTFEITHAYADVGVRAEHGYTALSRSRGETHLWVNDAPGPLGECTHVHGNPVDEDTIDALVRRLSQSVIEPPAHDQGLPVESATDRQLIEWRANLEATIWQSPIATDHSDEFVAVEAAIDDARDVADRLQTSGARAQIQILEKQRETLLQREGLRDVWLEENAPTLHHYSAVAEEIRHRISARVASYELAPPDEILIALGEAPIDTEGCRRWSAASARYAEARMMVGPGVDLGDPAVIEGARWRDTAAGFRAPPSWDMEPIEPRLHVAM